MSFHPFDVMRRSALINQYDISTQAVIDSAVAKGYALPGNLSPLDNLIRNIKTMSAGAFWNRLDSMHFSAIIGNSTSHHGLRKLNIKNPSGQERVFYGGLSLNFNGGIQGNATTGYIDHVTPLNSYANYKQNDAGVITVKTLDAAGAVLAKDSTGSSLSLIFRYNNSSQRLNTTITVNGDTSGIGAVGLMRNNATTQSVFNKTTKVDLTAVSAVLGSYPINEFVNPLTLTNYYLADDLFILVGASYTQAEFNLFRTYFNQYLVESGFSAIA